MEIFDFELVKKEKEYKEIYTFSFRPQKKIDFIAGQWVHLGFPSGEKDKTRVRHMSFASAPEDEFIEFSMDLASNSWFKTRMARLKKGDIAKAFKINGSFTVDAQEENEIVFLTGGIGITPVRSILRDMVARKVKIPWTLVHVSRDQFLYEDELGALGNDQWRVNRSGVEGIWETIVQHHDLKKFYVSGSDRFVNGMTQRLKTHGIPEDRIICENFNHQ